MVAYHEALFEHLAEFLTPERQARFTEVLENRTEQLTVVLVDFYQQHNASAVLRSCDAFGIQHVHIVETVNQFRPNRDVSMGTDRWLTLHRYSGPDALAECVQSLKDNEYQIAATVPTQECPTISSLRFSDNQKIALLLGNEKDGLSDLALHLADRLVHLPMYGFVESFNVSVATALCLQQLSQKLRKESDQWGLPKATKQTLLLDWTKRTVPNSNAIENRFRKHWNGDFASK